MEISDGVVMRVFRLGKSEDELDPSRAVVHMPVGAKPFAVVPTPVGLALCVLLPRVVGVRIPHPVYVIQPDVVVVPLVGRRFGDPIGICDFKGVPLTVVADLPWPEPAANG